ncbi:Crp/Fnr family transcriptional regulator [Flavobacteriaceae bacterium F89]|uniref:Crp/Fnr family transcriptional regulator n=1 Tax=Cerina litoralis TaxID=2874477 RepID=A0AAE3JUU0_9FLAO|nr:Crp/Fnr family transcriptional regulator [Cerina litoralis]MCG2462737.1 Crp/Fnr family transcriptional regulator [Cerina litoralis]
MSVNNISCLSSKPGETTCMNCSVRNRSLLSELSYSELERLNKNRYTIFYKPGEIICKEGSKALGLICLKKGKVKIIRRSPNGAEQIVALKKPVDFIGINTLMGEDVYLTSAVALENVSVCIIEKNDFYEVIGSNEHLAFKIIRLLSNTINDMDTRMVNLTQKHVRARLADALLLVNGIYGTRPDQETLNAPLKRSDLAALSNMTTANAIRVLSSFAKENLIELDKRDIKVKNFKGLRDISFFGR